VTYSIVARDPETGEMGVATQSQAFAVGSSVPFALPGHGVIATQSMAEPMYGSVGLDLLQGGFTAQEVLTALQAAEEAGGDFRGRRSAAIMVIRATTTGRPWHDTVVDLRVDDSRDPVAALADLLVTRARYQDVVRAFQQAIDGDPVTADRELELLRPMDPATEPDQLMWRAVVAALAGREDAAREMLGELATTAPQFLEAARRFGKAGLMPADVVARIVPAAP
jgi:uncharacterized Ntn-hydrolase superfamily protein